MLKGMEKFLESLFSFLKLSEHHLDLIGASLLAAQDTHGLSIPPFLEPGMKRLITGSGLASVDLCVLW